MAFVGFHLLYSAKISEYSKEFVAGCIGAIITIAATAVLLRSQTRSEILKSQMSATFEKKLDAYSEFIDHLNKINSDNIISPKEINSTIDLSIKLSLFCKPFVIKSIHEYLFQIVSYSTTNFLDLDEAQKSNWLAWQSAECDEQLDPNDPTLDVLFSTYGQIVYLLREDLIQSEHSNEDENFDMSEAINHMRNLRGAKDATFNIESKSFEYSYD